MAFLCGGSLALAGVTAWWFFGRLHVNKFSDLAPWIAAGWASVAVYWVVNIVVVEAAVDQTMALVYDPMKAGRCRGPNSHIECNYPASGGRGFEPPNTFRRLRFSRPGWRQTGSKPSRKPAIREDLAG